MSADMISLAYVRHVCKTCQAAEAITQLKEAIEGEQIQERKLSLLVNLAFVQLSLELTKSAIGICDQVLRFDPSLTLAFLVKGLAFLWRGHEEGAVEIWDAGLTQGGPIQIYSIMKRLSVDPNIRAHMYQMKFDVAAVLEMIQDNPNRVCTESDTQQAFAELRGSVTGTALAHFNMIISADPNNWQAYKGRGCSHSLLGNWNEALADFTKAIDANVDVVQCLKYRGIAHAALDRLSAAVIDLSKAISLAPEDPDALLARARLQLRRKLYGAALKDFQRIRESIYGPGVWLSVAECQYALGNLNGARDAIERSSLDNQKKLYCQFLILRDLRVFDEALTIILRLVQMVPVFFMFRTAADYLSDLGRPETATRYYKLAMDQIPGDAETQRLYAISLFEIGEGVQACRILQEMSVVAEKQESEVDVGDLVIDGFVVNGDIMNFGENKTDKVVKAGANTGWFMLHLMKSVNEPMFKAFPWPRPLKTKIENEDIPESFSFSDAKGAPECILQDADRLGKKCVPEAKEVVDNQRVIRALGLCVLFVAHQLKHKWFVSPDRNSWQGFLKACSAILNLADLRKEIHWVNDPETNDSHSDEVPIYYLQKGERVSPRFYPNNSASAIQRLSKGIRKEFPQMKTELDLMADLPIIYSVVQEDLCVSETITVAETSVQLPSIEMKYLGDLGWNFTVQPLTGRVHFVRYSGVISELWESLMKKDHQAISYLSFVISLIWIAHPLTEYSHELGHVLFHAFILAADDSEVRPLSDDLFMKCMIEGAVTDVETVCSGLFSNKTATSVRAESLEFWNEIPSIGTILKLLKLPYVKEQK